MRTSSKRLSLTVSLALICSALTFPTTAAPVQDEAGTQDVDYVTDEAGCYYNFQHYAEGDRIVTNEPCLNCTCHNRMLMCYLRVCPFTKAIGQDCTVEKHPEQCCPVISCPEVPVRLLTSTTEQPSTTTAIGGHDNYGCTIRNSFFADGVQVPSDPKKPCELCYCIRNRTACVMQECTLHVEGCRPVYQPGICCPVKYECDYEDKESSSASYPFNGTSLQTTAGPSLDCKYGDDVFADGESIATDKPCEHCYCMRGDIVCAVQDCGEPLRGKDCTPLPVPPGQCCPASYTCANETIYQDPDQSNDIINQVQGIINSMKDDTRPDILESTADIINPEEVMAPSIIPSHDSEIENHETLGVRPDVLHDYTENEGNNDSKQPSTESDALKPEPPTSVFMDDDKSQINPTTKPVIEVDLSTSTDKIQPQEDDTNVSNAPVLSEITSSPASDSEISQSPASEVSGDELYQKPEENTSTHTESNSAPAVDVAHSPEENLDKPSSQDVVVHSTEINHEDSHVVHSDSNAPLLTQTFAELDATESAINNINPQKQDETATQVSVPEKQIESMDKESTPEKLPENEISPSTIASDSTAGGSLKPDNTVRDPSPDGGAESSAQESGATGNSGNNIEINFTHPTAQDKIVTISTSVKTPSAENYLKPNDIYQDEVHQDFLNHDDEELAALKPTENVEQDEKVPDTDIADPESNRVPGEGDCLIDGKTYKNTTIIPTSNPCHVKCECISSIPACSLVSCPPPPPQHQNCEPIQPGRDTCCPTYACAAEQDSPSLEAENQVISASQPALDAANHTVTSNVPTLTDESGPSHPSASIEGSDHGGSDIIPSVHTPGGQVASDFTIKNPEYDQTTYFEYIETTVQPASQAADVSVSSDIGQSQPHDAEVITVINSTQDETSPPSGEVQYESPFPDPPIEEVSSVQAGSDAMQTSQNDAEETVHLQETTVANVGNVVTEEVLESSDITEKPFKEDEPISTSNQAEVTSHVEENVVSSFATPEVIHDHSDTSSNSEKEPESVNVDNYQQPLYDTQSPSESATTQSSILLTEISESAQLPEQDIALVQNTPTKDIQTNDQKPTGTTEAAETQTEVVTELESGDVYIPEQQVGALTDETVNTSGGENAENGNLIPPTGQADSQPSVSVETAPSHSAVPPEAILPPIHQDDVESHTESIEYPSHNSDLGSKIPAETATEAVYTTNQPHDQSNVVVAQDQSELAYDSEATQADPNQTSVPSLQQAASSHDVNHEGSTQASPMSEIIFHDDKENILKPESDSSIYIPSNFQGSENSISGANPISQSNAQENNEIHSSPNADSSDSQTTVTQTLSPESSQDHLLSDGNNETSDKETHSETSSSDQHEINEQHPPMINEAVIAGDDVPSYPSKPLLDTQLHSESSNPITSGINEGNVAHDTSSGIDQPYSQPSTEEPNKPSVESDSYDIGSETESTVAPLGVPGENVAGASGKPVPVKDEEVIEGESVHDPTAAPEMSHSSKPEILHQESNDEVISQSQSTDAPINDQRTTVMPVVEDMPSGVTDEIETNNGASPNSAQPINENAQELYDQTTNIGVVETDKIQEASSPPQEPSADSVEPQENVTPSNANDASDSTETPSQTINDVPSMQQGEVLQTVDKNSEISSETPIVADGMPSSPTNEEIKPYLTESDPVTHGTLISSETLGINADENISQSTEKAPSQDSIPSTSQEGAEAQFLGNVESSSINSVHFSEITPENDAHNVEIKPPADEILSQTVTEMTNNVEIPVDSQINQEQINVISSQNNINDQANLDKTEQSLPHSSEPSLIIQHSPGEPTEAPLSSNSQSPSVDPSDPSAPFETGAFNQDNIGHSSENPAVVTEISFEHGSSSVFPHDSDFLPSISTESTPLIGSESVSSQGQVGNTEEALKPSDPIVPEGTFSETPTKKPGHMPSQADLLTSIIQGHLEDQNKPISGFGSNIDAQLSDLLNKVSTPVPISSASSSTAHDTILQSSWTPKPMPPQSEESSHRPGEEESFPTDTEYEEDEEGSFGPGTCKYLGKLYVSAQQIPRDDPCDFCFCFRSDIICLQQSCPPPIFGCRQESIQGFCCPRYECPVSKALVFNSSSTSTTTTTLPPHFHSLSPHGENLVRSGCSLQDHAYKVGEIIREASGPCRQCICGADGHMKCDPKTCSPGPMLQKIMEKVASRRR
ncbi:unnamed protein product [Bemisia tabaci]|uniref:VWFC domain-containing protein n=1 Tax=Bemisia tabaci TaxID=7038 RepID=A0A9P0A0N3_BEMTA|nr:unnamed protein product [Bemisia tabaci]